MFLKQLFTNNLPTEVDFVFNFPANICLLKINYRNTKEGVKYVQS